MFIEFDTTLETLVDDDIVVLGRQFHFLKGPFEPPLDGLGIVSVPLLQTRPKGRLIRGKHEHQDARRHLLLNGKGPLVVNVEERHLPAVQVIPHLATRASGASQR